MDVGFVLDSSGSLSASEFQQVKDFVDLIANSFLKNKVGSRVGLMQYSILPKMNVRFSDELTREQFRSVLDKVRYEGGYTRLDRALKLAAQELFVNEEGSRKDIPRVMVIITDGINTEEPDSVALDTAVAPLKRAGVTVFVVCIGSEKGRDEMYLLTEQNRNLYFVRTYNELSLQLRKVSKDICESGGEMLAWTRRRGRVFLCYLLYLRKCLLLDCFLPIILRIKDDLFSHAMATICTNSSSYMLDVVFLIKHCMLTR